MKKLFALVFVLSFLAIIPTAWAGPGPPPVSDCCFANGTPGCDDMECQDIVCPIDPFCCDVAWDGICASEAVDLCGDLCTAPPLECPSGAGECCTAHAGPGCNNCTCQETVCGINSDCCDVGWDSSCAAAAQEFCAVCEPSGDLCGTFCSPNTPEDIPDLGSIANNLPVMSPGVITDVKAYIYITHTWDSDLDASLSSPAGTTIPLFSHVGGSGDNFGSTCGDQVTTFPDFVLMDNAFPVNLGAAPFVGTFSPQGNLFDFDGENPNGTWTLNIADTVGGDDGTLQCWCLDIFCEIQGCSAGFWPRKGKVDYGFLGCEDVGLLPGNYVETCFNCKLDSDLPDSIKNSTCENIMKQANLARFSRQDKKWGAAAKLLRQGVAAMLNACNPCVNYPLTIDEIRTKVCDLLDDLGDVTVQDINTCKDELDTNNNGECTACEEVPCECPHDECTSGDALQPCCSECAAAVCAADPFCCDVAWDGICVSEVGDFCSFSCNAGARPITDR